MIVNHCNKTFDAHSRGLGPFRQAKDSFSRDVPLRLSSSKLNRTHLSSSQVPNLSLLSPLSPSRDLAGGSSLSFSRLFYDEHWSKHRVITCLDWSPQVGPAATCLFGAVITRINHPCDVWLLFGHQCRPLSLSCSTQSCSLPPITTTKMPLMSRTASHWCGTSSLRRPHRSISFTVRYAVRRVCFVLFWVFFFFFAHKSSVVSSRLLFYDTNITNERDVHLEQAPAERRTSERKFW